MVSSAPSPTQRPCRAAHRELRPLARHESARSAQILTSLSCQTARMVAQPHEAPRSLALDAQEILTALLRMDTTNPPGNERPAVDYLAGKFREVGIEPTIL